MDYPPGKIRRSLVNAFNTCIPLPVLAGMPDGDAANDIPWSKIDRYHPFEYSGCYRPSSDYMKTRSTLGNGGRFLAKIDNTQRVLNFYKC